MIERIDRINYLTANVETGATHYALQYLRKHDLTQLQKVVIIPDNHGFICAQFQFDMKKLYGYSVNISGGFNVGYRGEGPYGLHDIMVEAGFPEDIASKVFEISPYEKTELERK